MGYLLVIIAAIIIVLLIVAARRGRAGVRVSMGAKLGPSRADELLKRATALKKQSRMHDAVEGLRAAYKEIAAGQTEYSVATFLRLPAYLAEAGRDDEAWGAFNRLLAEGYPHQSKDAGGRAMDEATIYDKMRLFLQRRGKPEHAVKYGVFALVQNQLSLRLQRRSREGALKDEVDERITKLMRKADREGDSAAVTNIVWPVLQNVRSADLFQLGHEVDRLLLSHGNSRA